MKCLSHAQAADASPKVAMEKRSQCKEGAAVSKEHAKRLNNVLKSYALSVEYQNATRVHAHMPAYMQT